MNEISHQDPYVYRMNSRYIMNLEPNNIRGDFNIDDPNGDPLLD